MNPVTEDIKDLLVSGSIGAFAGTGDWGIYIGKEPDAPNKCITIYDTGGPVPLECMSRTKKPLLRPSFQIRVRGTGYTSTYTKIRAVIDLLRRYGPWTIAGTRVKSLDISQQEASTSFSRITGESENNPDDAWIWQSFVPTVSGSITEVEFSILRVYGKRASGTFRIYSGVGRAGTVLYTLGTLLSLTNPLSIVITDLVVNVSAGSPYSIEWASGNFEGSSEPNGYPAGSTNLDTSTDATKFKIYITKTTVPAVKYLDVFQQGEELYLMQDEKKRYIWVCNFYAFRKENNS